MRRVDERATVEELLQSAFLQRAAAEGTIPSTSVSQACRGESSGGDRSNCNESGMEPPASAEVPRLTALVESFQDDEVTGSVLKIVSSIIAEAKYEITLYSSLFAFHRAARSSTYPFFRRPVHIKADV